MPQVDPVEIPQNKTQGAGQPGLDQEQRDAGQCQFEAQGERPKTTKLSKN